MGLVTRGAVLDREKELLTDILSQFQAPIDVVTQLNVPGRRAVKINFC